jgi:predicted acetyltransferase
MYLIDPGVDREGGFKSMVSEWATLNEPITPPLFYDIDDFPEYVESINSCRYTVPQGFVKHSTYWLVNDHSRIIGTVNIRHELTEGLKVIGGHIGYGIRPSERRKGYGNKILKLALLEVGQLDISKVLITCDKDNAGSKRVIENNGGQLWNEDVVEGIEILRYWIDINDNGT